MTTISVEKKSSLTVGARVKKGVAAVILNLVLWVFSLSCIYPLVWMFYSSLKEKRTFNANVVALPTHPTWLNYIKIFNNPDYHLGASMISSVRTTLISLFFIVIFGFIVGYIFARVSFKGSKFLYLMFMSGLLIPIHSLLVPIYVVFSNLHIDNRWFTLPIPYIAFGLPIAIFLVDGYVKTIPTALEEAAAIDGSSFTSTLFRIILPICRPILTTVAIIQTFGCWNEFSFALVLIKSPAIQTVPLAMTMFRGQFASDYPKIMAALLITMSPVVVFYFAFSKQIIKGMVSGAVKG